MRRFLCLGVALALGLAGCGGTDTRTDDQTLSRRPLGYDPAGFPDLPLELLRGYRLAADHEPLAVAYAAGALRRFHVVFISGTDEAEVPQQALDRLAGGLGDRGWTRIATPENAPHRYTKGDERLDLDARLDGGRLLITWNLAPAR